MKDNQKKRKGLRSVLYAVLSFMMVWTMIPGMLSSGTAYAATGDEPAHTKALSSNSDGTYQLELSVTGDADTTQTRANANVLVMVDTSNSMTTYRADGSTGRPDATHPARGDAAEKVVYDFTQDLFEYQNEDDPATTDVDESTNIQMALMTFNHDGHVITNWTSTESAITGNLSDTGTNNSRELTYNSGTNWEEALQDVLDQLESADKDPTFVIFVTDGAPSQVDGTGSNTFLDADQCYGPAQDEARSIELACEATKGKLFGIYAYGKEADYLDDVIYYAVNGTKRASETSDTVATDQYYSASDTAALQQAVSDIFSKIVETLGVNAVSIDDGTTSNVTVEGEAPADLLDVDGDSFRYWISIPVSGSPFTFKRTNPVTAVETTYTVKDNGDGTCTVTWGESNTLTVNGSVTNNNFKFEWTGANELSNGKTPPSATYTDSTGAVKWDLSSAGTLLDGVTYSVTFDCWPSQYTYDLIAKIKNGDQDYSALPAEVRKYLTESGGLLTNTKATLTYSDSRDGTTDKEVAYNDLSPIALVSEPMKVSKEWENELDARKVGSIKMTVLADEKDFHEVTLSDPAWSVEDIRISTGLMRTKGETMQILDPGHDFTFKELGSEAYNWELVTPVVHPMLIDGTLTLLYLKDENYTNPDEAKEYTINGKTYYVVGTGSASLEAFNYRRSNLNLAKVVDGEDADPNQTFPFTLTVENSKASSGSADDTNSDYYVWFSIYDTEAGAAVTNATVSGTGVEGPNADGYYHAPSGTAITVNMKANWNLRFTNLPTGTKYTFEEGTLATGYAFKSSVLTGATDNTFVGAQTSKGTIAETNKSYQVTYTNVYEKTNLEITKVWEDANNQDGKRLTPAELKAKLTLSPAVDGIDPTIVDNGDNTYTITYTGLPRFNNGTEVTYTVTESAVDGYTTTGSPAEDHGTITNTHTPETTKVDVEKVWIGPAGEEVTVTLYADNEATDKTLKLNADNKWKGSFENLPVYKAGTKIVYSVVEAGVTGVDSSKYSTVISGNATDGFTITNTNTEKISVSVTKAWDDASNQDGKRPGTLTLTLNGLPEGTTAPEPTIAKSGDNWTYTWANLPKYDSTTGEALEYTVSENSVPTGYTVSGSPAQDKGTITNSYTPETTKVDVEKVWIGPAGEEVTVTLYADNEATDKTLKLNADNKWKGSFENLPVYKAGTKIVYSVVEAGVTGVDSSKYSTVISGNATDGFTITNTNIEKISVTVTKAWEDNSDQDRVRPENLTLTLNGLPEGTTAPEPTIEKSGNNWTYTWENLPKYDSTTGAERTYTVTEEAVPTGYTVSGSPAQDKGTITNTHTPAVTEASVEKVWEDSDNQDGKRPASLTVTLYADGVATDITATLNAGNQWKATQTGLPKLKAGEAIVYTWVEDETALPEGYELTNTVVDDETNKTTLTNSYEPEVTSASVKKVWSDAENQDGKRPTSLTVTLSNGQSVTLNEENKWTAEITGLPVYAAGEKIEYTWTEDETGLPEGYELTSNTTTGTLTTLTNSYTPETIDIPVEKEWDDFGKSRPASIKVHLFADGVEVQAVDITPAEDGSWSYTFTGMPKFKAGTEIEYTITEDKVPYYNDPVIESNAAGGFTITNPYVPTPAEAVIDGTKTISGYPSDAEPVTFSFTLSGEGVSDTKTTQGEGTFTFDTLTYDTPGTYTYTVSETAGGGDGWTNDTATYSVKVIVEDTGKGTLKATVDKGESAINFLNKYKPEEVTADLSGTKTLVGRTLKAEEFAFILKEVKDGEASIVEKVSNDASGSYKFKTLTFDKTGTYNYTIEEENTGLPGVTYDTKVYKVTITVTDDGSGKLAAAISGVNADGSGADFTNTYKAKPTSVKFSGTKKLVGRELRNEEFSFILSGEGVNETVKNSADGKFAFSEIKYDKTGEYKYTIVEDNSALPAGVKENTQKYEVTVTVTDDEKGQLHAKITGLNEDGSGANFTNTYQASPTKLSIVGEKVMKNYGKPLEGGEFNFTITGKGEVVAEETEEETPAEETPTTEEATPAEGEKRSVEAPAEETAPEEVQKAAEEKADAAEETAEEAQKAAEAKEEVAEEAQKVAAEKAEVAEEAKKAAEEAAAEGGEAAETAQAEAKKAEAEAEEAQAEAEKAEAEVTEAQAVAEKAEAEVEKAEAEATETADAAETEKAEAEKAEVVEAVETAEQAVVKAAEKATETIDAPLPAQATVQNAADGSVVFGEIEFTRAGTYTYEITESGSMPGVTNDPDTPKKVVVVVTDDGNGQLKAAFDPDVSPQFTFTNTYNTPPTDSSVTDTIPVIKELAGHSLADGDFTFVLTDEKGKTLATAKNNADGTVKFPAITFTKEGSYTYKVKEVIEESEVITYDTTVYTVTAEVTNNYDGKDLVIEWKFSGGEQIVFNNTYSDSVSIDPPVKKVVKGTPKKTETYTFMLEANDPSFPMPDAANGSSSMTMSIKGEGAKEFGEIVFTEPGAYSYTVTEVEGSNPDCEYDGSVYTVIATVTEDSKYKLHVKTEYLKNGNAISTATFKFVNEYEEEDKPKTGDENNLAGWLAVMALAGTAGGGILFRRRREED